MVHYRFREIEHAKIKQFGTLLSSYSNIISVTLQILHILQYAFDSKANS